MEETQSAAATIYWCHRCNRRVEPVIGLETVECPLCQSGFVEQMSHTISTARENRQIPDDYILGGGEVGADSDRSLSLWAPVLLGMMSNPRRRRRFRRRLESDYEDNDDMLSNVDEGESELDRELQSFVHTRRRNSAATIVQFLQGIRAGTIPESNNNSENADEGSGMNTTEIRDRNRVILINRLNQTIILQGGNFRNRNDNPSGSLGDYFVGPGLELLLQHLAENDPNRYGTPPAKKEAVEAMPTVKINENCQCSVCLDDLEMGSEAKEMPCKHKFHSGCILPWLELHSSCPVCRYQLPSDGRKMDSNNIGTNINISNINRNHNDNNSSSSRNGHSSVDNSSGGANAVEESNVRNENRRGFSIPWFFSNLFSSSGSRDSSSSSSTNATRNASTDEN